MAATTYIVFAKDGNGWIEIGVASAGSPRGAITEILTKLAAEVGDTTGTFVATPKRSWQPKAVAPKQAFSFGQGD